MTKTLDEYPHPVITRVVAALTNDALTDADPASQLDRDFEWPPTTDLLSQEIQDIVDDPSPTHAKALLEAIENLRHTDPEPHGDVHEIQIPTDDPFRAEESLKAWQAWKQLALELAGQLYRATLVADEARTAARQLTATGDSDWRDIAAREQITLPA